MRRLAFLLLVLLGCAGSALAHEPTLATLDLTEIRPGVFLGRWSSAVDELRTPPLFPPQCLWDDPQLDCRPGGLDGTVRYAEAPQKQSALVLRVHPLEGAPQITLLAANQSSARIRTTPRRGLGDFLELAGDNLLLGVQHILQGPDHLLFVLGLLWVVTRTRQAWRMPLVKTVTAFTVAHSITLAAATLGLVRPPVAAVNASVALSILFLGPEMVRAARGETSLSLRRPHIVAFCFGLLHGFGFATALQHAGLSGRDLPWALAGFNVGVEAGQLLFILLIGLAVRAADQLRLAAPRALALWPAYVVGTLGAFWTIGRVAVLLEL